MPVVAIELCNESRESQGVDIRWEDSAQWRHGGSHCGNASFVGSGDGGVMHVASAELGAQFFLLSEP
jgi:hypothetical protein